MVVITLLFRRGEPLRISPDPAYVPKGEVVKWVIAFWPPQRELASQLSWEIYFDLVQPFAFGDAPRRLRWEPDRFSNDLQQPEIVSGPVIKPGDYKYGVLATRSDGSIESDDDPYLIVR